MIYISYYYLISLSLLGYGFFLSKLLKVNYLNFGFLGLMGISFLISISYLSTLFFVHDYSFNILILLIGIFSFIYFFKKKFKKDLFQHLTIFTILIVFILVSKNHDDFSTYHYPYSFFLTQFEHPIGFGHFSNGFRNPSSLFFLSSFFYLPKVEFYLLNISPAYFLGFSNLIFINYIFNKKNYKKFRFVNFLSLLSLSFVNIFFYRMAEHGTDRSGQILIFAIIILLLIILNSNNFQFYKKESKNLFNLFLILLSILITLKQFYFIYIPFVFLVFTIKIYRNDFFNLVTSRTTFYFISIIFIVLFYNFINSGCLIYPAVFTCSENLYWSFSSEIVKDVNEWYELWSKAGATPNYVVENRSAYISHFNWVNNWFENYFFNKVSDFILGIIFLIFIFWIYIVNPSKLNKLPNKFDFKLVYIFLVLYFFEWFLKHPALRYGGYQLIALIFFLPLTFLFCSKKLEYSIFLRKSIVIVSIVLVIFLGRNTYRIVKENSKYNYNPFISTKYNYDEKFYNRYINYYNENYKKFKEINFLGKKFVITKIK